MIHPPFSPSSHQKLEVKLKRKLSLLFDNCGSKGISLWVFTEPYLLGFLRISERTWPSFCPTPTLVQITDFLWIMKFQIPYCYFSTSDRTLASTFIRPDFFHDIFKIKIPWIWPPKFSLFVCCLLTGAMPVPLRATSSRDAAQRTLDLGSEVCIHPPVWPRSVSICLSQSIDFLS